MRSVGTVVRGIRTPIIKDGDNLEDIVVDSLMKAKESEGFEFNDRDVVAVTEAVVGISQGNYASVDDIAKDIKNKFNSDHLGVVFPTPMSRNRFSLLLKGFARGCKKITMLLSYPRDEVGNELFVEEEMDKHNLNPYIDVLSEDKYQELFGDLVHPFTGINYVDFFRELVNKENCEIEFVFGNNANIILDYTKDVIVCNIHDRERTKKKLKNAGANKVLGMDEILTSSIDGSGYNSKYGLLGSNKSTEERIKLFPEHGQELVDNIQKKLKEKTGKTIEVMVYGDGAFKDPVGKIWELADPVVSPAYTSGLEGTPNEIKLKFVSDNKFPDLHGDELKEAIKEEIRKKEANLKGQMITQGTTPRRLTDLIGSLCDLTSGSGDKGTPVVFIQGYFDNLADE
ncbi:MAG: coenzyme F420-0:L-glutamate ligase [Bacilli bacterium]|nr:coenzyme F420-0:L-glutamate ligase [Bacilli bacterium]